MAATVGSALHWWARTKGDQPAILLGSEQLSYRQLHDWSGRLARRLADDGVKPGDRVGLLAPNALQWPVAALAIMKAGAVLVPFNARLKPAEVRKIADDAGLSLLIAAPSHTAIAHEARQAGREFAVLSFDIVDAERTGDPDDFRVDRAGEEPIAVIFTSGSTGLSKGVILTSSTLLAIVLENTLTEEGFRPGTVTLLVLPLAFTPGLVYGLLITTVLGGTLVVEPELNPSRAVNLIQQHSVRALFGVPLIFESLSRAEEFEDADLSSLQTAIVGGAAVPTDLLKRWADKGVLLRQIYGMTEAGGVATATQKNRRAGPPRLVRHRLDLHRSGGDGRRRRRRPHRVSRARSWCAAPGSPRGIGTIRSPPLRRFVTAGCTAGMWEHATHRGASPSSTASKT